HTDRGEVVAVLRGRLKHRDDDRVVAGDVVELELRADGHATISGVRPRRGVLARRAAGERSPRAQPIAANVDQVVVVASARSPEPSPRLLDRFLVIAAANRIPAVLVANKIDLDRRALDALPGGYVVDTPGLREVGTWGIDAERLGVYFAEFRPFLDQCRFDNCRHLAEPGCGVRQAAERGAFDPDRLLSYQRIYEEVSVPSWSSDRRRGR